jgi:hypothetical protein
MVAHQSPHNHTQDRDIVNQELVTAMYAMQVIVVPSLGSMPGALSFSCDLFLNIMLIADQQKIAQCIKQSVSNNLYHKKQHQYDYAQGQQALKKIQDPTKLGVSTSGPYTMDQVHINGILTIELHLECIYNQNVSPC